jgi:phosphoglycolate phosphatase
MRVEVLRAGRLDPDIFLETMEAHALDADAVAFSRFAEALAHEYRTRAEEVRASGRALPGAAAALAALAREPAVVQTVLTGNVRPVAATKLAAFDLDGYLDLEIGAYGGDARRRSDLVALARRQAGARHGVTFDASGTVVVGDSRHDVVAGREGGALVVAVATGLDGEAELRALGADVVLRDLADTAAVLRAVLDGPARHPQANVPGSRPGRAGRAGTGP